MPFFFLPLILMSGSFEDRVSVAKRARQGCRRMVGWLTHLDVGPPGLSSASDVFMTFRAFENPSQQTSRPTAVSGSLVPLSPASVPLV